MENFIFCGKYWSSDPNLIFCHCKWSTQFNSLQWCTPNADKWRHKYGSQLDFVFFSQPKNRIRFLPIPYKLWSNFITGYFLDKMIAGHVIGGMKVATIVAAWIQIWQFLIYITLQEILNIYIVTMVVTLIAEKSNTTGATFELKFVCFLISNCDSARNNQEI